MRLTRLVLPVMQRQHHGRIVNIASESAIQPDRFMPHDNAAKAAIINLTKSLSKAYTHDGILVIAVSPAMTRTETVEGMLRERSAAQRARARSGRLPQRRQAGHPDYPFFAA